MFRDKQQQVGVFSIKDIEAVSGIRCHTLRIWETRYGVIKPKRTDSNIRYYDDDDLKYILNISILNRHGFKISEIAKMRREDLCDQVLKIKQREAVHDNHIKNMITAMVALDENGFHQAINTAILQSGLEQAMISVIFPFLNEVGILWQIGSIKPMHEHFATSIIKQKLYVAIDGNMGKMLPGHKKFLLFLPENEQHSLGLLFANFVLRSRGHEVFYLGQEVPVSDMLDQSVTYKPDYLFTILTSAHVNIDKEQFITRLCNSFPDSVVLLSGIQFLNANFNFPSNAMLIRSIPAFIEFIQSLNSTVDAA